MTATTPAARTVTIYRSPRAALSPWQLGIGFDDHLATLTPAAAAPVDTADQALTVASLQRTTPWQPHPHRGDWGWQVAQVYDPTRDGCVFCAIVAGDDRATVVRRWDDAIAIRPRHPVVDGHVLVIPHAHVADVGAAASVSARAMACAAELAGELSAANVITSKGAAATQTVRHLHLHVVPRADADGLPLPWTPQQAAQRLQARHTVGAPDSPTAGVTVVWAREPIPAGGPSVFLAGPTPRAGSVPSWRPAAIDALAAGWAGPGPLTVLTPESRGGKRAAEYHDQVGWETAGLDAATAILFWLPRDLETLPGFTTNVEFGLYASCGRVVLGAPPDCPNPERNRYLVWTASRFGVPVYPTLDETVAGALGLVTTTEGTD